MTRAKVGPFFRGFMDGCYHLRVVMPEDQGTMAHRIVDQAVAVDIPFVRAGA